MQRPTWDEYFMKLALVVSERATCPRASVGAVIVSADNRVLATGYNGSASGWPHCLDEGCIMVDGHCQRALHAEVNAIAHAARHGVAIDGARMYVTGKDVCRECYKVMQAANVTIACTAEAFETLTVQRIEHDLINGSADNDPVGILNYRNPECHCATLVDEWDVPVCRRDPNIRDTLIKIGSHWYCNDCRITGRWRQIEREAQPFA